MKTDHHLLHKVPVDLGRLSLPDWDELFSYLEIRSDSKKRILEALHHDGLPYPEINPGIPGPEHDKLSRLVTVLRSRRESVIRSRDGSMKLTLRLHDGHLAETVIIPEWKNDTLYKCSASISSQIGCFFGCSFCATGRMGFHRNLSTAELLDQVREAEKLVRSELKTELTHLYFMGMGEPMNNYRSVSDALAIMKNPQAPGPPPSRITLSTVGLFRQIRMLASDHPEVRLAVSVHSADQEIRHRIMPVSARLGLPEIRNAMDYYSRKTGNSVTIQYLLIKGMNDRIEDAEKLTRYLADLRAGITLIMYNDIPDSEWMRPENDGVSAFKNVLEKAGFPTDIRWCYGEDIDAGCGQLQKESCSDRVWVSMRHEKQILNH